MAETKSRTTAMGAMLQARCTAFAFRPMRSPLGCPAPRGNLQTTDAHRRMELVVERTQLGRPHVHVSMSVPPHRPLFLDGYHPCISPDIARALPPEIYKTCALRTRTMACCITAAGGGCGGGADRAAPHWVTSGARGGVLGTGHVIRSGSQRGHRRLLSAQVELPMQFVMGDMISQSGFMLRDDLIVRAPARF